MASPGQKSVNSPKSVFEPKKCRFAKKASLRLAPVRMWHFREVTRWSDTRFAKWRVPNFSSLGRSFFSLNSFLIMILTDTDKSSKLVHRRKRTKVDTLFSSLFLDASERRVWLSTESKILASTFGRFCLYRLKHSAIFFDEKIFSFSFASNVTKFCHAPQRKNFIKQILLLLSLRFSEFLKFAFCLSGMVTGHETAHFGPWHWLWTFLEITNRKF